MVFNPNDFSAQVNTYEIVPHVHGGCKSYRFKGYTEEELPLLFSFTSVKMNKKNHILMVMKYADFRKQFEEELG